MMISSAILSAALLITANKAGMEDLNLLDKRIDAAVQPLGASARPIDRRIKLARCPVPALIEPHSSSSLAVRCPQLGWRIRVNIVKQLASYNSANHFAPAKQVVVHKGEAVELRVSGSRFSVSATATALENGSPGETIKIRSGKSRTPMVARVVQRGVVEIVN